MIYRLTMNLLMDWHPDYGQASSKKFKQLAGTMGRQIKQLLNKIPRSTCIVTIKRFSNNPVTKSVEASGDIDCVIPHETTVAAFRDQIYSRLHDAITNGQFTFDADPSNINLNGDGFCAGYVFQTDKGLIWWPSVMPNEVATVPCPENPSQNATFPCQYMAGIASWGNADTDRCLPPSGRTKKLEELSQRRVSNETIESITVELKNLTDDISNFTSREVSLVTDTTENCLAASKVLIDNAIADNLLSSVNQMLSVDLDTLVRAEQATGATVRLVQSVERLGDRVETTVNGVKIVQPQVALLVATPSSDAGLQFKTTGNIQDDLTEERMEISGNDRGLPDPSSVVAAVDLASSVVRLGNGSNIQFAVYNNANFFKAAGLANISQPGNIVPETPGPLLLNSRVVSAKVGMSSLEELPDPVTVILSHVVQNSSKHRCVYWDFAEGGWSDRGCKVIKERKEATTCECTHLTNFALLMDIYGTAGRLPEIHKTVLSFISYIGCAVSMAGLLLTLITYFTFRKMLRDNPAKILVNLAIALLGIIIAFIFATQVFVRENYIACKVVAALTHYAILAAMAWMSVEAFYMYVAIVRVFHAYFSKFMIKCCLFGWGVPLLAVGVTMAINKDNYGRQGEICWLSRIPFFAAVLVPVSVTLIVNSVTFGLVINQLRHMDSRHIDRTRRANVLSRLRGAMSIMVLLGLTWIFAFFAVGGASVVFHYLFAIFNSLQGLFIFVFYCLLKKDVQTAWQRCLGCGEYSSTSPSTSKGTSNPNQTALGQRTRPPRSPRRPRLDTEVGGPASASTSLSQSVTNRL